MMTLKNFKTLSKDELKMINAGVSPDCEGGTRTIVDGVVFCNHYEDDEDGTSNLDDCLMGF